MDRAAEGEREEHRITQRSLNPLSLAHISKRRQGVREWEDWGSGDTSAYGLFSQCGRGEWEIESYWRVKRDLDVRAAH